MYTRDGYVTVPDVLDPALLEQIHEETVAICKGMGSDDIRDFLCIHFPHKMSELMKGIASHPDVVKVLTDIIGPNIKMMQSMLFIKAEGKPGQAWHQDESHIPTRDRSLTAAWIALDDATIDNGCLWVLPGSQRSGILYPTRKQDDPRYDCTKEAHGFHDEDAIPVEVPAGTAVIFNGYLLHRSLPNKSNGFRRALVNHYMSAESLLPWFRPEEGVPMAQTDHRDIVMVAGVDPYAFKGTTDLMKPQVRPDGEGGCIKK